MIDPAAAKTLAMDCGNNPCFFATNSKGMRTQGTCRCMDHLLPELAPSRQREVCNVIRATIRAALDAAAQPVKDTERLNWLETQQGGALVSDDDSLWAVSLSGFAPMPDGSGPPELWEGLSFVERSDWRTSIREAIDAAMSAAAQKENS